MLRELHITNLALIESLRLSFGDGLNVFTGETGTGKSIIQQAISLLAGGRASASVVRTGAEQATVEALFDIDPADSRLIRTINELGYATEEDNLILRRTIARQGKSRYYINGNLATASVTGELCENLLAMASQHDHQQLLSQRRHLDIIDTVGSLWHQRQDFSNQYQLWLDFQEQYHALQRQEQEREQRRDYLTFQIKEIRDIGPTPGEDEQLEAEKKLLKAATSLIQLSHASHAIMAEVVPESLGQVKKNLDQIAILDPNAASLRDHFVDAFYTLDDLVRQVQEYSRTVPDDPGRLERLTARLDQLQGLKRKYGSPGTGLEAVLAHAEQSEQELTGLDTIVEQLRDLRLQLQTMEGQLLRQAETLSDARKKTATRLEQAMLQELQSLCMEHGVFQVRFDNTDRRVTNLTRTGWDRPEFMFSANAGEPVKPLSQVASGGELSRLTLGIKCLLARQDQVECVVFDEVDAGIGGQAAEAVAAKIKELAGHHQVLCITHLARIASYGDHHFRVTKEVVDQRTLTTIVRLPQPARVRELARMLSGETVTQQTLAYAEEMINQQQ